MHVATGRTSRCQKCLSLSLDNVDPPGGVSTLRRARLFGRKNAVHLPQYGYGGRERRMQNVESPHADLAEARGQIEKHGYWRHKGELEDAEQALLGAQAKV